MYTVTKFWLTAIPRLSDRNDSALVAQSLWEKYVAEFINNTNPLSPEDTTEVCDVDDSTTQSFGLDLNSPGLGWSFDVSMDFRGCVAFHLSSFGNPLIPAYDVRILYKNKSHQVRVGRCLVTKPIIRLQRKHSGRDDVTMREIINGIG
jgi:hypothetical protein